MNPTATPTETNPLPTGGKKRALGRLLRQGFLPNMIKDRLPPEAAVEAAVAAGIEAVEISCRRPDTIELLKRLRKSFTGVSFGVSSLIEDGPYFDFLQARGPRFPSIAEAADAGADFLVSMIAFSPETYRRHSDVPLIPGVHSADEARRQLDLGASLVKFSNGGPAYFRGVNGGPMHFGLPLLATGGIRPEHVPDLVAARVLVCVSGFDLILQSRYEALQTAFDAAEVKRQIGAYLEKFREGRKLHRAGVDFASGDAVLIQKQSGQFLNV